MDKLLECLSPGTLIIDMRSLDAEKCLAFYEGAADLGLEYVEAAVRGGPKAAVLGELTIAVGATSESFARARPSLETMATLVVHSGDIGTGRRALELQDIMSAVAFATAQEVLNASAGVHSAAMTELMAASATALGSELRGKPECLTAEFDAADALARAVQRLRAKRRSRRN
jgi:3-hydroxyisobutyrate dehydrogenase-like beta-hydroxyacid dehydrogenase